MVKFLYNLHYRLGSSSLLQYTKLRNPLVEVVSLVVPVQGKVRNQATNAMVKGELSKVRKLIQNARESRSPDSLLGEKK